MKFNLSDIPPHERPDTPKVGNLYAAKGGQRVCYWCLVAVSPTGQSGHYLGLDDQGEICSTASYAHHGMTTRRVVGFVDVSSLVLDVEHQDGAP